MATSKTGKRKPAAKKTATKKPAAKKSKPVAPARKAPEVWICIVEDWVRYHGKGYVKGGTILVNIDTISETDLATLKKYFELKPTGVMADVSEPIELLDEGDNHGSHSN